MNMNRDQFWRLLEPIHPEAASFCRKLAGDRSEGDDLYQEALLTAVSRFHTLKDVNAFRPWLFRIVINRFRNRCRGWWWRRRLSLTSDLPEITGTYDPRWQYDLNRWLDRALGQLSPEDRAIVVLHEVEGWTTEELASLFGKPRGTIKTRICRAKRKMRRWLERFFPGITLNLNLTEATCALQKNRKTDD